MFTGLRADLTKAFSFNPLYVPSQAHNDSVERHGA
jgi:hypothetical protein